MTSRFSASSPWPIVTVVEVDGALRGPVQARGDLQQRRLSGPGRPHDRGERSAGHRQGDAVEGARLAVAASEDANDVVEVDHGRADGWLSGAGPDGGDAHHEAPEVGSVHPPSSFKRPQRPMWVIDGDRKGVRGLGLLDEDRRVAG